MSGEDYGRLMKAADWMSDDGVRVVQVPSPEVPLLERGARTGVNLASPEDLHEIKRVVEECFAVELAVEPLPEQCAGAPESEASLEPFSILEGERFSEAVARLAMASQGRWEFEEIHGVPLLRPNNAMDGSGTLLDTIVSAEIEASSMWEALCMLALAVNQANNVQSSGGRSLIIRFLAPTLMRLPPPMFLEEREIRVSLKNTSAREGLCAIFSQVGENIRYAYTCVAEGYAPSYDYIDITAHDADGNVVDGGKLHGESYKGLTDTKDWMSDDGVRAVQVPLLNSTDGPGGG